MSGPTKAKMVEAHEWTDGGERVLILRRINKDGTSKNKFKWPDGVGVEVSAPDWNDRCECGGGLHGWPWGMGLGEGCDYSLIEDRWLVVSAVPGDIVGNLEGGLKCKAKTVTKLYDGPFDGAWAMINGGRHRLIEAMSKMPPGDSSTAASSGDYSKAASSGNSSTAASSGDYSKAASSGYSSTAASSGNSSTAASSGNSSKAASSGDSSKAASSGDSSKAQATGANTIAAVAGYDGKVMVGNRGAFAIAYESSDGPRFLCGKVGENGLKANTWYCVNNGELVEAQ